MDKSKSKKGLGKGLGALFEGVEREAPAPKAEIPEKNDGDGVQVVKIRDIEPNPDQPRRNFDKEKLAVGEFLFDARLHHCEDLGDLGKELANTLHVQTLKRLSEREKGRNVRDYRR